jgi:hypothetical protein
VHNHPSGDPTPSQADIHMTKAIIQIVTPLGISVHDRRQERSREFEGDEADIDKAPGALGTLARSGHVGRASASTAADTLRVVRGE